MIQRLSFLCILMSTITAFASDPEIFWDAVRKGDMALIKQLVADGQDINEKTKYGATALMYACDKDQVEVVKYLVSQGADVNAQDKFYGGTVLDSCLENVEIVKVLIDAGVENAATALLRGVRQKNQELVALALTSSQITVDDLEAAKYAASQGKAEEYAKILPLLEAAKGKPSKYEKVVVANDVLASYAGTYFHEEFNMEVPVIHKDGVTTITLGGPPVNMIPTGETSFRLLGNPGLKVRFELEEGKVARLMVDQGARSHLFLPGKLPVANAGKPEAKAPIDGAETVEKAIMPAGPRKAAVNWPAFRGTDGAGHADGQGIPTSWDIAKGTNVRWKTPIPGIATACPIVWEDRVFIVTAVSSAGKHDLKPGNYGDVDSVEDDSKHLFSVYCLNKTTGKIMWQDDVANMVPKIKRHIKSTQANSSPVTDGKRVVSVFGTLGLLTCHDMDGKLLWRKELDAMDSGFFYDKSYQWGHAASPVIYKESVIVLADLQKDSYIAAYSLVDGKQLWRTGRDEVPQWGTPTVYYGKTGDEIVTNGSTIRGYDPVTGKELWTLGPNSEVTVGTPVIVDDLFYVTGGYAPVAPIYAIRAGSRGDLSLKEGTESSEAIAWSKPKGGTYIPSPIAYGGYLYTCNNDGRMVCFEAKTGKKVYQARVAGRDRSSFIASPIASDGRLYFFAETGEVYVAKAGPKYEELARTDMDEIVMATPAISDGFLIVRTRGHVYGIAADTNK